MAKSKRRLRKDVEEAKEERDTILGSVDAAIEKVDVAQDELNAFIEGYRRVNGVLRGEDVDES